MKTSLILLSLFLTPAAFGEVIQQKIDDAFSYRFEEKKPESKRDVAGENKIVPSDEKVEVVEESNRDVAAENEKSEDTLQKHKVDVPYWKY
ncbi:MAG: hypothetical protein JNM93_07900 [Bacteriovoracaceae bacterium]|nr:hypothetical protein [Bacteriovoracaceae bacterium]